jgi:hypothetical protein
LTQVRLNYVDFDLTKRVVGTVTGLVEEIKLTIAKDPRKLRQTRESSLVADLMMLAAYHYALGEPIQRTIDEFRQAAEATLKVFELRGTEPTFPASLVTLDSDSPAEAPEVISRESLHPPGSKDYSLTNSRSGLKAMYMALASGHVLVAQRLAQLVWDPPDADYIGEESEVCTPDDQHLAYAVKHYILGEDAKGHEELGRVKDGRQEVVLQVPLVRALLDRDGEAFIAALRAFLKWHEKEAKKKSKRTETDLYLSLPALGLTMLALRAGLITVDSLPTGNPHFPVEMIEMTRAAAESSA